MHCTSLYWIILQILRTSSMAEMGTGRIRSLKFGG